MTDKKMESKERLGWEVGECERCNEENEVTLVNEKDGQEWMCWDCLDQLTEWSLDGEITTVDKGGLLKSLAEILLRAGIVFSLVHGVIWYAGFESGVKLLLMILFLEVLFYVE